MKCYFRKTIFLNKIQLIKMVFHMFLNCYLYNLLKFSFQIIILNIKNINIHFKQQNLNLTNNFNVFTILFIIYSILENQHKVYLYELKLLNHTIMDEVLINNTYQKIVKYINSLILFQNHLIKLIIYIVKLIFHIKYCIYQTNLLFVTFS